MSYGQAILENGRTLLLRGRADYPGGGVTQFTGADALSLTLRSGAEDGCVPGGRAAATLTLRLRNESGQWRQGGSMVANPYKLSDARFTLSIGVRDGNEDRYESLGVFYPDSYEDEEGGRAISVHMSDALAHALDIPFTDGQTYPRTLSQIAAYVAARASVGVAYAGTLAGGSVSIAEKPDWGENCTVRGALSCVAQASGRFLRMSGATLELCPVAGQLPQRTLTAAQALSLTRGAGDFIYNRLCVTPYGAGESDADIARYTDGSIMESVNNTLYISDNPLFKAGANALSTLADALHGSLAGMRRRDVTLRWVCDPTVREGDAITYTDLSGNQETFCVTGRYLSFENGALRGELRGRAPSFRTGAVSASGRLNGRYLAKGSVYSDKLAAQSVTAERIAAGAITADKIASGTITAGKLAAGLITADCGLIAESAIQTSQIADASITDAKIVGLTASKLTAGTIDASVISVNNLTADNITAGTINGQRIPVLGTDKLEDGAVTGDKVADNAIATDKLVAEAVTAGKIASGAILTNHLSANAVTAGKIAAGAISTDLIAPSALSGLASAGINLLKGSGTPRTNSNYSTASYDLACAPAAGDTVTLRLWGTLGAGKTCFAAYNSGGIKQIATLTDNGDGTYSATAQWAIGGNGNTFLRIYALPSTVAAQSTITKAKLEFGSVATVWTPSEIEIAEDGLDLTYVKLSPGEFKVRAGGSAEFVTDNFSILSATGGKTLLRVDESETVFGADRVSAKLIAGNVINSYPAAGQTNQIAVSGSIMAALNQIGKYLTRNVAVTIPAGTYNENVTIAGFCGPGTLTLTCAPGAVLNGRLLIQSCQTLVTFRGTDASNLAVINCPGLASGAGAVHAERCAQVRLWYLRVTGASGNATDTLMQINASHAYVTNCTLERSAGKALLANEEAQVYAAMLSGGTTGYLNAGYGIQAALGSVVVCYGTTPHGETADTLAVRNSQIFGVAGSTANPGTGGGGGSGGGGTMSFTPTDYSTFCLKNGVRVWKKTSAYAGEIRQGSYGAAGASTGDSNFHVGCLWFDLSALAGHTITGATLTIKRGSDGSASVTPMLCAVSNTAPSGVPDYSTPSAAGAISREAWGTVTVPTSIISTIQSGGAIGFCEEPTGYSGTWSPKYTNFYTDGSVPTLTVTYT